MAYLSMQIVDLNWSLYNGFWNYDELYFQRSALDKDITSARASREECVEFF